MLLKQNGIKQNELVAALGISRQVMSNILSGSRKINVIELRQMADFFHVSMERLLKSPSGAKDVNAVHAFLGEVKTLSAGKSLKIADEMADMILFYARVRSNAEELDKAWKA